MDDEIDCEFTDSVICPWCGEDQGTDESWTDKRCTCDSCGKEYLREVNYDVTFITSKITPRPPAKGPSDDA